MAEKSRFQISPSNLQGSFALLSKYRTQTKRLREGAPNHLQTDQRNEARCALTSQALSAVTIVKMALQLHSTSLKTGDFFNLAESLSFKSAISSQNENHLKHVLMLLNAAEEFSNEDYDQAENLLVSVPTSGNLPIERVITCYARYLRERIDAKKCRIDLERRVNHFDLEEEMKDIKDAILVCEQKLPLIQISNYAAVQTILDSLSSAETIHFIDIGRKLCSYWIVMMQALSNQKNCQLKQLKITAVCSPVYNVAESGKVLSSIAKSMKIPLIFNTLHAEKNALANVNFESEKGEKVAVFMDHSLHCLSACTKNVEGLLRGLKRLNPHVMVAIDVEESFTTSSFGERVRGALSMSSAVVDCLESCLEGERRCMEIIERIHFQESICNGVMNEDTSRIGFSHHRRIDFWREYFSRFGILETEMSEASLCQARLMIGERACWSSCSLGTNGKSMILGWKGIPLRFVSAWKFPLIIQKHHK
ncbi:DELLA protein 1-like [Salvia divinorum]|uniref:DELLA protein 1-like n=1 Tax=Salvia divinorum TaxID=28513 RepID=A0ABD1GVL7_SALDI